MPFHRNQRLPDTDGVHTFDRPIGLILVPWGRKGHPTGTDEDCLEEKMNGLDFKKFSGNLGARTLINKFFILWDLLPIVGIVEKKSPSSVRS